MKRFKVEASTRQDAVSADGWSVTDAGCLRFFVRTKSADGYEYVSAYGRNAWLSVSEITDGKPDIGATHD